MSNDSLSDASAAQSVINSAASFAQSILTGSSSAPSSSVNQSAASQSNRTAEERQRALRTLRQLADDADQKISHCDHVGTKRQAAARLIVKKYRLHNQAWLRTALDRSAIHKAVLNYKYNLTKLTDLVRVDNLAVAMLNRIKTADLENSEKRAATGAVNRAVGRLRTTLKSAANTQETTNAFVSGVSTVKGALARYVLNNRANVLESFGRVFASARRRISRKQNLSLAAKSVAARKLDQINADLTRDLNSSGSIVAINQTKRRGIEAVNQLFADRSGILNELTNFDNFVSQACDYVSDLKSLSLSERHVVNQAISRSQKTIDDHLNYLSVAEIGHRADRQERAIARVVVREVVKDVRKQLTDYYSEMDSPRKRNAAAQIHQSASRTCDKINRDDGSAIEIDLSRGIYAIRAILAKNNDQMYRRQVTRHLHMTRSQVDQFTDLDLVSRGKILYRLRKIRERSLEKRRGSHSTPSAKLQKVESQLQALLMRATFKNAVARVNRTVKNGQRAINHSRLSPAQKQRAVDRLNKGQQRSQDQLKRTYQQKRDLNLNRNAGFQNVRQILRENLATARHQDLKRVRRVTSLMYRAMERLNHPNLTAISSFEGALDQLSLEADHKIRESVGIAAADRIEQVYENRAFHRLTAVVDLVNSAKAGAVRSVLRQTRNLTHQVEESNLSVTLRWQVNNQLDRCGNSAVREIFLAGPGVDPKRNLHLFSRRLRTLLARSMRLVRQNDARLLQDSVQEALNRIAQVPTTVQAVRKSVKQLKVIQLRASRRIKNASNLMDADHEEQKGSNAVNQVVNAVIGTVDRYKYSAHQRIDQLVKSLLKRILKNRHLAKPDKQRIFNQIVKTVDRFSKQINADPDRDVEADVQKCVQQIHQVIKLASVREMSRVATVGCQRIKKMSALAANDQKRALEAINYIRRQTVADVKRLNNYKLIVQIMRGGQHNVDRVLTQISDLDPVKRTARNVIHTSTHNLKQQIQQNHQLSKSVRKQMQTLVNRIGRTTNRQISDGQDTEVDRIVNRSHARLDQIALKNARGIGAQKLSKAVKNTQKRIHGMKKLTKTESVQAKKKLDQAYQQSVHDLKTARSNSKCLGVIQLGQRRIHEIFSNLVGNNSFKKAAHAAIVHKTKTADQQVDRFENLRDADKKASHKLLTEIQKQTLRNIGSADGIAAIYSAEHKGTLLIRKVINKVSSANVIVAAVQSAHSRITHSRLGREQKQAAIKQVNALLNNGMKKEVEQHPQSSSASQAPAASETSEATTSEPSSHHRQIKAQSEPHYVYHSTPRPKQRSKVSAKIAKPLKHSSDPVTDRGTSVGYHDGLNGHDPHWDDHQSAKYVKAYQNGYRKGSQKYQHAYRSGGRAGRNQGMIAGPMAKLSAKPKGYVDGYRAAYRRYKITLPIRVFAKRPVYVHSKIYFDPNNRIKRYRKHRFEVTKIIRRHDGSLCYRVAGGYITADPLIVSRVSSRPTPRAVRVINPRGIYSHHRKHFSVNNSSRLLSKGTRVKVAGVAYDGNQMRYRLRDGTFITADQHQVKKAWL